MYRPPDSAVSVLRRLAGVFTRRNTEEAVMKNVTDPNHAARVTLDRFTNRCLSEGLAAWPAHEHPLRERVPGKGSKIIRWQRCEMEACAPERMSKPQAPAQEEAQSMPAKSRRSHSTKPVLDHAAAAKAIDLWWTTTMPVAEIAKQVGARSSNTIHNIVNGGYAKVPRPAGWPSHRPRTKGARGKHVVETGLPLARTAMPSRRSLTDAQVREIIDRWWNTDGSLADIAKAMGVTRNQVTSVVAGSYPEFPRPSAWPDHRPVWKRTMERARRVERKLDPHSRSTRAERVASKLKASPNGASRTARRAKLGTARKDSRATERLAAKLVEQEQTIRELRARVAELEGEVADATEPGWVEKLLSRLT
jgi:hypothetical protein